MVIFPLAPDQTIAQMWSSGTQGRLEWTDNQSNSTTEKPYESNTQLMVLRYCYNSKCKQHKNSIKLYNEQMSMYSVWTCTAVTCILIHSSVTHRDESIVQSWFGFESMEENNNKTDWTFEERRHTCDVVTKRRHTCDVVDSDDSQSSKRDSERLMNLVLELHSHTANTCWWRRPYTTSKTQGVQDICSLW